MGKMVDAPASLQRRNQGKPGFDAEGWPLQGEALVRYVRDLSGDTVLLGFSLGKDSLAMWLFLRDHFDIKPYYLYYFRNMSFEEEALAYYERVFGCHIARFPHPVLYDRWRNMVHQPPEVINLLLACQLPDFDYVDIDNILARVHGPMEPFTAWGYRGSDNLVRYYHILRVGAAWGKNRRLYYAIWDWKMQDVADCIRRHAVSLPRGYTLWGQSMAVPYYRNLKGIRDNFPDDWRRILDQAPLIEAEMFRWEKVGHG